MKNQSNQCQYAEIFSDRLAEDDSYTALFLKYINFYDGDEVDEENAMPARFQHESTPTVYRNDSDTESDVDSERNGAHYITNPTPALIKDEEHFSPSLKRKRDSEEEEDDLEPVKRFRLNFKGPNHNISIPADIPVDILNGTRKAISLEELQLLVESSKIENGVHLLKSSPSVKADDQASNKPQPRIRIYPHEYECIFCKKKFTRSNRMRSHYTGKTIHGFITPNRYVCQLGCESNTGTVYSTRNQGDYKRHNERSKKHQARLRLLQASLNNKH